MIWNEICAGKPDEVGVCGRGGESGRPPHHGQGRRRDAPGLRGRHQDGSHKGKAAWTFKSSF